MFLKKIYLFFLFFIVSCASNQINNDYCIDENNFFIEFTNTNLNDIDQKNLLNFLVNNSGINITQTANNVINLNINITKRPIILSANSTTDTENLIFSVNYKIYNKINNTIIDKGKIIITDNIIISNNRFANYTIENNLLNNFFNSLSNKLKNKIDIIITNNNCNIKNY